MPDPFESVLLKLSRAKMHLDSAKNIFETFAHNNAYVLRADFDNKRWELKLLVETVADAPNSLALTIGDAAHNARSALDYLMFALARPPTKQAERYVCFPIGRTRKDYASILANKRRNPIPNVPRGVKTVLERLQPYHRRQRPETAILWKLKQLDDWDKHRMLATAISALSGFQASITFQKEAGFTTLLDRKVYPGVLKPGAVIAWAKFRKSHIEPKVQVEPKLTISPVFGPGSSGEIEGLNVVDTVRRAIKLIESEVIPSFRPFV